MFAMCLAPEINLMYVCMYCMYVWYWLFRSVESADIVAQIVDYFSRTMSWDSHRTVLSSLAVAPSVVDAGLSQSRMWIYIAHSRNNL